MQILAMSHVSQRTKQTAQRSRTINRTTGDNVTNSVPQLERCCQEGKISFWGGQIFWVGLLFSDFFVDLKKKKKRSSHRTGLLFSKFSVDLKKQSHRNKSIYLSLSFQFLSKKSCFLATAATERMSMLEILGGQNFCLENAAPFAPS